MKKRIIILGSTGSIGTQTLDVISQFPDRFQVVGLSTLGHPDILLQQIEAFSPTVLAVSDRETAEAVRSLIDPRRTTLLEGPDAMTRMIAEWDCDVVVAATSGSAGLAPTLEAIRRGRDIALANKETLVKAGHLVMALAREHGIHILPIDSEHNAIFQCLTGQRHDGVRRIVITCSGGPFLNHTREQMDKVTVAEALNHPRWRMGPKITIDSATLMNKGLEIIEGHHLFDVDIDRIDVIIHPESIVHSMVEFVDGSILAQLGPTDMRLPILYCLAWPERLQSTMEPLDLCAVGRLTFREPDLERFPVLGYAREAAAAGGTMPAVLNAANEVAVRCFLEERIGFGDIADLLRHVIAGHHPIANPSLEEIEQSDQEARQRAEEYALAHHNG